MHTHTDACTHTLAPHCSRSCSYCVVCERFIVKIYIKQFNWEHLSSNIQTHSHAELCCVSIGVIELFCFWPQRQNVSHIFYSLILRWKPNNKSLILFAKCRICVEIEIKVSKPLRSLSGIAQNIDYPNLTTADNSNSSCELKQRNQQQQQPQRRQKQQVIGQHVAQK